MIEGRTRVYAEVRSVGSADRKAKQLYGNSYLEGGNE